MIGSDYCAVSARAFATREYNASCLCIFITIDQ